MLGQYDYRIEHCSRKKHQNADALSRNPLPVPVTNQVIKTNAVDSSKERIAIDIIGPLPVTESRSKYILVVGDYFTKWKEAFLISNQEARTIAEKLVKEVIARYGTPEQIHSDQGHNFEAQLFQEMCLLFNMDKTHTTPYHLESNGMIERMNRTIQDMLAKHMSHHQRDWDEHLPLVIMTYWASVHTSTQYTPFYLLFGHEVRLPVEVMFGRQPNHQPEVSEYIRELRDTLEEVHEHARKHLQTAQKRQKDHYDQRIAGEQIEIGDRVFLHDPALKKGQTKKLHSPWQGPYIVITKIGDVTYRIQAEDNPRKRKVVHFNRLKACGVLKPVEQQHRPTQTASSEPQTEVRRPHVPPRYVPDETDLMYMDETAADVEVAIPERLDRDWELPAAVNDRPVHADRPRRKVRPSIWMRHFLS